MSEYVTVAEYAKRKGIRENAVREQIRNGSIPAIKHGRSWMIHQKVMDAMNHPRAKGPSDAELIKSESVDGSEDDQAFDQHTSPLTQAKTAKERAMAEIKRLEALEKRGELVSVIKVQHQAFELARRVRDALLLIPQNISPEIACETDPAQCELILERELRRALEDLTNVEEPKDETEIKEGRDGFDA